MFTKIFSLLGDTISLEEEHLYCIEIIFMEQRFELYTIM